jgi:hypothetical protein
MSSSSKLDSHSVFYQDRSSPTHLVIQPASHTDTQEWMSIDSVILVQITFNKCCWWLWTKIFAKATKCNRVRTSVQRISASVSETSITSGVEEELEKHSSTQACSDCLMSDTVTYTYMNICRIEFCKVTEIVSEGKQLWGCDIKNYWS